MSRTRNHTLIFGLVSLLVILAMVHLPVLAQARDKSVDQMPPTIEQPQNVFVAARDASGAGVTFDVPSASDAVDGPVGVLCNPSSGSWFPLGTSTVVCGATDTSDNQATVSFTISVSDQTPPTIAPGANISVEAPDES